MCTPQPRYIEIGTASLMHRHGRRKVVKSEEARSSEAQRAKVRGPRGRGGVEFLGKGSYSFPPYQL